MIEAYLNQAVQRRPRTGVDAHGEDTYGTAVTTVGRWREKGRLARNAQGEQVLASASVSLKPTESIAPGDQVSLDGAIWRTIIEIRNSPGLGGDSVLKMALCE